MFAPPVVYPLSIIRGRSFRWLIVANPMTPIVETFCYGVLGNGIFDTGYLSYSAGDPVGVLFAGIVLFNRVELGIDPYIDTPVKRHSPGTYVQLALAVAAHLEPGIPIVDEVLAVGDAEFQKSASIREASSRTLLSPNKRTVPPAKRTAELYGT